MQENVQLIRIVNAHLKNLSSTSVFNVEEDSLKVASNSLRFLLVNDELARAWKASGLKGPMTFETWCITSTKGSNNDVVAYCGGGDILPGIPFSASHGATLAKLTLNLKDFCKRPRIQVGQVTISTIQLIQYVANTLGGAHFDPGKSKRSKKPHFDLLRRLEAGEISGPPLLVNGRNLLHHEILSVAQVVIRSPEVAQLRAWRDSTA